MLLVPVAEPAWPVVVRLDPRISMPGPGEGAVAQHLLPTPEVEVELLVSAEPIRPEEASETWRAQMAVTVRQAASTPAAPVAGEEAVRRRPAKEETVDLVKQVSS